MRWADFEANAPELAVLTPLGVGRGRVQSRPDARAAGANESDSEAIVRVLGPGGADVGFREVVRPGNGFEVAVERPGPGGWAVSVDGQVVSDWMDWPSDNAVIDFTLLIQGDGSVDVQDI